MSRLGKKTASGNRLRALSGLLLALALVLAAVPHGAFAAPLFQGTTLFAAGTQPKGAIDGDFNGDGHRDLAVANTGDNTVSVLLGNGDGTFSPKADYPVGVNPMRIVAGHFNADANLDLAAANVGSASVSVLLGNGDGTFAAAVGVSTGAGSGPYALVVGSFDADANEDLAVTDIAGEQILILLGAGDGTFGAPAAFGIGGGIDPQSIAAGDFDGDGTLDLATSNYTSQDVTVLPGAGDGTFPAATTYAVNAPPYAIAAGTFDGNAGLDLAVATAQELTILHGDDAGAFPTVSHYLSDLLQSVAAGDFNGDGITDIAAAEPASFTVGVWFGKPDGTLAAPVHYAANQKPAAVLAADWDGDGAADLTALNELSGDISILLSDGAGKFRSPAAVPLVNFGNPSAVATADFNADGHLDYAVADDTHGIVEVMLGGGDGTFAFQSPTLTADPGSSYVAAGLIDAGSVPDLVVVNAGSGTVSVFLGNGDGTFGAPTEFIVLFLDSQPYAAAIGDFDGDGNADLAVTSQTYHVLLVYLGNGAGAFTFNATYPTGVATGPQGIVAGSFNGDASLDLAVVNRNTDDIAVFLGNGDGTFGAAVSYAVGDMPAAIVSADFNGDTAADLAVTDAMTDTVSILLGNVTAGVPDGTFAAKVDYPIGASNPQSLTLGDFDGTGGTDLAIAGKGNNKVAILQGNGDGTFTAADVLVTGRFAMPTAIAAGDFYGDAKDEFLVAEGNWKRVSLYAELPDAGQLSLQAATISVSEDAGTAVVTVTRTGGSGNASVQYATAAGTATAGSDYTDVSGTLVFHAGETVKTFTVPILDDAADESDETVAIQLSNPGSGATLGAITSGTLTIQDDDAASTPPPPGPPPSTTPSTTPSDSTPESAPTTEMPTEETPTPCELRDIQGHWAEANIREAVQQGFVHGYPDCSFLPDAAVTRAEFAVMLVQALQLNGDANTLTFSDQTQIAAWARPAIEQAVRAGILSGYDDGSYRPDRLISRAEMASMIAGTLGQPPAPVDATGFADDVAIPAWARDAVEAVRVRGIVTGRGGNRYVPAATATRAEAVTVLLKLLEARNP